MRSGRTPFWLASAPVAIAALCAWPPSGLWYWLPLAVLFSQGLLIAWRVATRRDVRRALARDPIVWCGAAAIVYAVIQSANPWAVYLENEYKWWLQGTDFVTWMPSGVSIAWSRSGPVSSAITGAAALTTYVATRAWLTNARVRSVGLVILSVHALAWCVFGVIQRLSGSRLMYGIWKPDLEYFFASFAYKNHAAAYLVLLLAVVASGVLRRKSSGDSSGWVAFCWMVGAVVAGASLMTGTFIGLVTAVAFLGFVLVRACLSRGAHGSMVARAVAASLATLVLVASVALAMPGLRDRKHEWIHGDAAFSLQSRVAAWAAATRMHAEKPWLGWGAGSFSYGFVKFQREVPILVRNRHLELHWEHAHNDWIEATVERGWLGMLPILAGIAFLGLRLARETIRGSSMALTLGAALTGIGVIAFVDFPLANFGVLALIGALGAMASPIKTGESSTTSQDQDQPPIPSLGQNRHRPPAR